MYSQESHIFLDSYVISLNALDKEKDKETDIEPTIFAVNESSMILQLPLPYRRLWNYTILAHGCKYHPITEMTTLSKEIKFLYGASCVLKTDLVCRYS